jgi:hypothetical protein
MSLIVKNSDFVGKYELSTTRYNTDSIDAYIQKYEPYYLNKLLGVELNKLFQIELSSNNPPTTTIWKTIYDNLYFDYAKEVFYSNGIKEMLLGLIYYHYTMDLQQNQTPVGVVSPNSENSLNVDLNGITISRYNDSVNTFKVIQTYIQMHLSNYILFNGQELKYEYFF